MPRKTMDMPKPDGKQRVGEKMAMSRSRSSPDADKKIDKRGMPERRNTTPGYGGRTVGTPGYIAEAARRAEKMNFGTGGGKQGEHPSHRISDSHYGAGKPDRGATPKLQDPDRGVRESC